MLQTFDERNRDLIVSVNGHLVHRDRAAISPFDSAVQGGDAVWEGLRLYQGKIFRLEDHLARLRRSAAALAFASVPSDEEITGQIRAALRANEMTDNVHIRLTLTRGVKITSGMDPRLNQSGPTLIVLAEHKPPVYDQSGITLVTASVRRPPPDCLDPKIHHNNLLSSILAKIEANVAGADDAVMLDQRGFVAETNATHLFLVTGGRLVTPATVACPEGITRAAVLELAAGAGIGCDVGRPQPDPVLRRGRGVRHRHHGWAHAGHRDRRADHRRRLPGPGDPPAHRPVRRPDRVFRHARGLIAGGATAVIVADWSP